MSDRQVVIAIDAMGGENSPEKVLIGAEIFLRKAKNTKIIFFGEEKLIIKCKLTKAKSKRDYVINIINIDEIVKWRKRNGITQKEMGISNILGLSFRHYQSLEEKEILPIIAIKTLKSNLKRLKLSAPILNEDFIQFNNKKKI